MGENEKNTGETKKRDLDRTDREIITLLQEDGRISNTEIAKRLDISEATARGRLKRLIDQGYIQIVAVSNPFKLGFGITGDLNIHVDMKKIDSAVAELVKLRELWYIVMTTGGANVNAEFIVETLEDLNDLVHNTISKIDGIIKVDTSIILKYVKRNYQYGTAPVADA